MKFKLINVKTNTHDAKVGSCEYCFSIQTIHEPVYIVEIDGMEKHIDGYDWEWGHYSEIIINNVIKFAEYLSEHEFEADDEDMTPERLFNQILQEYNWYGEAVEYEVKEMTELKQEERRGGM